MRELEEPAKETKFEPVLGFWGATAVSIGGIIGSGIFFIIGLATAAAGPAVILSLVLAGAIAMLTALSFASLGSKIQKEGGEYQFVYIAFGPKIGFLGGIVWVFSTAISAVTVSLVFSSYVGVIFPFLGGTRVIAALSCLGFMLLDMSGLRVSSKVNNALVVIKVGVLMFFILAGLPFLEGANFHPFLPSGGQGVFSAAFLIFFAYAGFGKITAASEEVKDAYKNVPRAIITSVTICAILYTLTGLVAVGVSGEALASTQFSSAPLAYVMLSTGFRSAFLVVAVGAVAATSSVLLIQMLGMSRTIYAMSANKQLPASLSVVHPRLKTPYRAEALMGVAMALGALFIDFKAVVTITSLGILSYYALINLAAVRLRKQKGYLKISQSIPILGFGASAGLVAYSILTGFA